jgi:hypothetical protein
MVRRHYVLLVLATAILFSGRCLGGEPGSHTRPPFIAAPHPRIAMMWAPVRDDNSVASYARHDLIMIGFGGLRLKLDGKPPGLADGFTAESLQVARKRVAEIRRMNADAVIIADLLFYEYPDRWLPGDHPWWLRVDGKRQQFWPGTHRMNWNLPDYRRHVVEQTVALKRLGVDGVFYDNIRNEPEPWTALLKEVRERVGDRFLILANAGYAVGQYDFAAPYLNGIMYESGWSHNRTDWDDCIEKMQQTQTLLRKPTISVIERFEEIRDQAGWPGDPRRGQKPAADEAARRWSECYALIIGDFYYLFSDNTSHRHDWYPDYDVKIGLPVGPGQRVSKHVWRRRYEKALVVVNLPGAEAAYAVRLPSRARDVVTGKVGTDFVIPPGDGRILEL